MNVLSLFSGVGGLCSLGLGAAGHKVVALCEIDDKARSILRRDHPDTPIWEDVTNVRSCVCVRLLQPDDVVRGGADTQPRREREAADIHGAPTIECPDCGGIRHGRVDIVAGGSPCQDLSVAGRRAGLGGGRSGLFWHQCRIAAETGAPWVLWENVAGALSSNNGEDFAAVLWGLTGFRPAVPEDGWRKVGVCVGPDRTAVWRLLDARWFGVAQRRRRVFIVAGPRDQCGPEVLVEPESCGGDSRTRPTPGAHVAALTGNGVGTCGPDDNQAQAGHLIGFSESGHGAHYTEGIGSLRASDHKRPEAHVVVPTVSFHMTQDPIVGVGDNPTPQLSCGSSTGGAMLGVAYPLAMRGRADGAELEMGDPDIYNSLRAGDGGSSRANTLLTPDLAVRRLTPRECERLMGWPDDHTRWADDGTEIADSHRYRMCGNGVVAPVAEWIGHRLMAVVA